MALTSFKYNFDPASTPGWDILNPEQKQQVVMDRLRTAGDVDLLRNAFDNRTPSREELQTLGEHQKEMLRFAQQLGKESLAETMKAKMFYDLPKNVAQAFAGPQAVMIAGMSQVPGAYREALGSVPRYDIRPGVAASYSTPQYFS